jgi:predicted DNA-binding transcriptional regulator AlpA
MIDPEQGTSLQVSESVSEKDAITLADVVYELRAVRAVLASQQAELLSATAAARFLGISVATLYRLAANFVILKPITVSRGCKRWKRASLTAYVASLEAGPGIRARKN